MTNQQPEREQRPRWLVVKQSAVEPVSWWIDHDDIVLGPFAYEEVATMTAYHLNDLEAKLEEAEKKAALLDWWQSQDSGWRMHHIAELGNRYKEL